MSRATSSLTEMNVQNYLTPLAESFASPELGFGSRAVAFIASGTPVATFGGIGLTHNRFCEHSAERRSRSFQLEHDLFFLGPVVREPGDAINHSCNPNCGMRNATMIVALRDIAAGEELTFDYAMSDASDYDQFVCRCGHPSCRKKIGGGEWKHADLQAKYRGFFSPYIQRLIAGEQLTDNFSTTFDS